jgi:hypothetical protein
MSPRGEGGKLVDGSTHLGWAFCASLRGWPFWQAPREVVQMESQSLRRFVLSLGALLAVLALVHTAGAA